MYDYAYNDVTVTIYRWIYVYCVVSVTLACGLCLSNVLLFYAVVVQKRVIYHDLYNNVALVLQMRLFYAVFDEKGLLIIETAFNFGRCFSSVPLKRPNHLRCSLHPPSVVFSTNLTRGYC